MPVAGYVRYKTEAEALGAIAALNESSMDGLPLRMGSGMAGGWGLGYGGWARGGVPYFGLQNLRDTRDARVTGLVWTILNWILFWTRIGVRTSIQTIFTLSPTGSSCANRNCIVKIMWMWHNLTISYYASWTYFTHLHAGSPYRPRALCHTPRTDPESGAMDRQTTQHQRPGEDDAPRQGDWFTCWLPSGNLT